MRRCWVFVFLLCGGCVAGLKVQDAGGPTADAPDRDAGTDTPAASDQAVSAPDVAGSDVPAPPPRDGGAVDTAPDPNLIDCPNLAQHILMLDFRSGWWAGAGGGGGEGITGTIFPLIADQCPGTRIEFHHILKDIELRCDYPAKLCKGNPLVGATSEVVFGETDWNNYTQIWILSGSEQDASDLPAASAIFQKIADASKAICLPFFIGLGSGFIDHGNKVAEVLGLGWIADTELPVPNFWIYSSAIRATSTVRGAALRPHTVFIGVDAIADVIDRGTSGEIVRGDRLIKNPMVEVIATDTSGASTIGVGRLPATRVLNKGRPFVIDAGLQRFYVADKAEHTGTLKYLRNLTNYLGSVGCKSDEDPIIVP